VILEIYPLNTSAGLENITTNVYDWDGNLVIQLESAMSTIINLIIMDYVWKMDVIFIQVIVRKLFRNTRSDLLITIEIIRMHQ
jgi:hypothetical protein